MRRHVLLGLVIALAVVVGFALAAENSEEASPPAGCGGGSCPAAAGCSSGGCCGATAAACSAEKGCCDEKEGCCAKKCVVICPVSGDPASESIFVAYGGGKVFFRCEGCKAAFEKEPEKFTTKANLQLVLTGQVVQKGCPLSGRKCNPETEISVSGAKVAFCCNGCQGKVAKAEGEKQLELVFSADAFKKAFEIKKEPAEEKKEESSTEEKKS